MLVSRRYHMAGPRDVEHLERMRQAAQLEPGLYCVLADGRVRHVPQPRRDRKIAAETGRDVVGAPLAVLPWVAPADVTARRGMLEWSGTGALVGSLDTRGLLDAFVPLADAPDDAVAAFARRYGVLGCCRHGEPFPHVRDAQGERCPVGDRGRDPLATWRALAMDARDILMSARVSVDPVRRYPFPLSAALSHVEDRWLRRAAPRLAVAVAPVHRRMRRGDPVPPPVVAIGHDGFGLFAALAVQLLVAVQGAEGLASCASCQRPFFPRVRRRTGQRRYCTACGLAAARRNATRVWRARQRGTR